MTDADASRDAEAVGVKGLALPARTYRHLDRVSKLLGLGLVALGLDVGGSTPTGLALAAVGTTLALTTVFVRRQP
jgi:hypothetical protein